MSSIAQVREERDAYYRAHERMGCFSRVKRNITRIAKAGIDLYAACTLSAAREAVFRTGGYVLQRVYDSSFVSGWTLSGRKKKTPVSEAYVVGDRVGNRLLAEKLSTNAKKLGLKNGLLLAESTDDELMQTRSDSFDGDYVISCAPSILMEPGTLARVAQVERNSLRRSKLERFARHPEFAEFLGTSILAQISKNIPLLLSGLEIGTGFLCKTGLEMLAHSFGYDTSSSEFRYLSGMISLLCTKLVVQRAQRAAIFAADRKAMQFLTHPSEAHKCLELLEPSSFSLLPSPRERIANLGFPQGEEAVGLDFPILTEEEALHFELACYRSMPMLGQLVNLEKGISQNIVAVRNHLASWRKPIAMGCLEVAAYSFFYDQQNSAYAISNVLIIRAVLYSIPHLLFLTGSETPQELRAVEPLLQELQAQHPIAKPIKLAIDQDGLGAMVGYKWGSFGSIVIFLPKNIGSFSKEVQRFILAHEYSHALNNDFPQQLAFTGALQMAGALIYLVSFPDAGRILNALKFGIGMRAIRYTEIFHSRYMESRADRTAFHFEPSQEIRNGAVAFFDLVREANLAERSRDDILWNRMVTKLVIRSNGDYLGDLDHPLISSRKKSAETR